MRTLEPMPDASGIRYWVSGIGFLHPPSLPGCSSPSATVLLNRKARKDRFRVVACIPDESSETLRNNLGGLCVLRGSNTAVRVARRTPW
jgi:hypothetical protein